MRWLTASGKTDSSVSCNFGDAEGLETCISTYQISNAFAKEVDNTDCAMASWNSKGIKAFNALMASSDFCDEQSLTSTCKIHLLWSFRTCGKSKKNCQWSRVSQVKSSAHQFNQCCNTVTSWLSLEYLQLYNFSQSPTQPVSQSVSVK